MLTGREIELGFLRAGYKTHKQMGDACGGIDRLTIFRIIKKGQKPTVEQLEKIKEVIGKYIEPEDPLSKSFKPPYNPNWMQEKIDDIFKRLTMIEQRLLELEKKLTWNGVAERRKTEQEK